MRMRKLLLPLVAACTTLGLTAVPASAIIGGRTATDSYSWIVDLGHGDDGHGCGGGLIAPRWVVTAGHCLPDAGPGTRVRVGSNDRTSGGELRTVAATFHPDEGDLGLIELDRPVEAAPARTAPMPASGPIRLLGWGAEDNDHPTAPRLLKQLDTTVQGPCGAADELCVQASATATACHGDSGTPAVVDGAVAAVTSRGPIGDCGAEGFTVYTAVAPHADWIHRTMQAH